MTAFMFRLAMNQPVDAAVLFVTQVTFKGVSRPMWLFNKRQHKFRRCLFWNKHVVLDNEIVPVQDPDRAVRSYLRVNRTKPFVGTSRKIPPILLLKACPIGCDDGMMNQPYGRLRNKRGPVPERLRVIPGRIQLVAGGGCESA